MYHFNYFSSSFPGKLADGELINGPNKEAAALFYHSLHPDSFACLLLFQTIALLRFQPEIVSSLKRTQSYPSPQILINYRLLLQHESMNRAPTRAHGPRVVETPQACECGTAQATCWDDWGSSHKKWAREHIKVHSTRASLVFWECNFLRNHCYRNCRKTHSLRGMVAHSYYPNTQEAEAGEVQCYRQPGIYRKVFDQ